VRPTHLRTGGVALTEAPKLLAGLFQTSMGAKHVYADRRITEKFRGYGIWIPKHVPESWLASDGRPAFLATMIVYCGLDRVQHAGEIFIPTEDDNCRFCITSSEVTKELINRGKEHLATAPYLAVVDKQIAISLPDKDVYFCRAVERLAYDPGFVVPV
jgi:hypothetical protein